MMLENLDSRIQVLASDRPASEAELASLLQQYPNMPGEYLDFTREATEVEFDVAGEKYLRIWRPSGCSEMDVAYGVSRRIPGAIPIGDNGGGRALIYAAGERGWGLYRVDFGDLDIEDAKWLAPTLTALLAKGEGLETL